MYIWMAPHIHGDPPRKEEGCCVYSLKLGAFKVGKLIGGPISIKFTISPLGEKKVREKGMNCKYPFQ